MLSSVRPKGSYLIFTSEEGGEFKVLTQFGANDWRRLVSKGYFVALDASRFPPQYIRVYPAFAEFVRGEDNRDFVVEELSGRRVPPEITEFDLIKEDNYED